MTIHKFIDYVSTETDMQEDILYLRIISNRTNRVHIEKEFKLPVAKLEVQSMVRYYLGKNPHWKLVGDDVI